MSLSIASSAAGSEESELGNLHRHHQSNSSSHCHRNSLLSPPSAHEQQQQQHEMQRPPRNAAVDERHRQEQRVQREQTAPRAASSLLSMERLLMPLLNDNASRRGDGADDGHRSNPPSLSLRPKLNNRFSPHRRRSVSPQLQQQQQLPILQEYVLIEDAHCHYYLDPDEKGKPPEEKEEEEGQTTTAAAAAATLPPAPRSVPLPPLQLKPRLPPVVSQQTTTTATINASAAVPPPVAAPPPPPRPRIPPAPSSAPPPPPSLPFFRKSNNNKNKSDPAPPPPLPDSMVFDGTATNHSDQEQQDDDYSSSCKEVSSSSSSSSPSKVSEEDEEGTAGSSCGGGGGSVQNTKKAGRRLSIPDICVFSKTAVDDEEETFVDIAISMEGTAATVPPEAEEEDEMMTIDRADEKAPKDDKNNNGNNEDSLVVFPKTTDTDTPKKMDPSSKLRHWIHYVYSSVLLLFSLWLIVGVILTEKARLAVDPHPVTTFLATWFLLVMLATIEGGQGCLIGLQRVQKENYANTHPLALRITTLAHKGDNMERYIVGRQFLVFLVVFLTNMCKVMNAPDEDVVNKFFLSAGQLWSGAAIVLTTITLGQLTAQVNAATCMLDFVNSHIMLFTTHVSLFIEHTGILHAAYLVQIAFAKLSGIPMVTKERRTTFTQVFSFWGRIIMSVCLLTFAIAVTMTAILNGKTTAWDFIPGPVSAALFLSLTVFVGMFEALQIALFEVYHMPEQYFCNHSVAKSNARLAFTGTNLQAILIGRQICVTTGVFMIARITTPHYDSSEETIFGVPRGVQDFFNTGLLSAFITTIVASLAWRIVAASFPLQFLSNPLTIHVIRLCLLMENSGICSASQLFALYHKAISGFRQDEEYLGKDAQQQLRHSDSDNLNKDDAPAVAASTTIATITAIADPLELLA